MTDELYQRAVQVTGNVPDMIMVNLMNVTAQEMESMAAQPQSAGTVIIELDPSPSEPTQSGPSTSTVTPTQSGPSTSTSTVTQSVTPTPTTPAQLPAAEIHSLRHVVPPQLPGRPTSRVTSEAEATAAESLATMFDQQQEQNVTTGDTSALTVSQLSGVPDDSITARVMAEDVAPNIDNIIQSLDDDIHGQSTQDYRPTQDYTTAATTVTHTVTRRVSRRVSAEPSTSPPSATAQMTTVTPQKIFELPDKASVLVQAKMDLRMGAISFDEFHLLTRNLDKSSLQTPERPQQHIKSPTTSPAEPHVVVTTSTPASPDEEEDQDVLAALQEDFTEEDVEAESTGTNLG